MPHITNEQLAEKLGLTRKGKSFVGPNPVDPNGAQYDGFTLNGCTGAAYDRKLQKHYLHFDLTRFIKLRDGQKVDPHYTATPEIDLNVHRLSARTLYTVEDLTIFDASESLRCLLNLLDPIAAMSSEAIQARKSLATLQGILGREEIMVKK